MTLPTNEFIRRFLMHVLPKGMPRIRHWPPRKTGRWPTSRDERSRVTLHSAVAARRRHDKGAAHGNTGTTLSRAVRDRLRVDREALPRRLRLVWRSYSTVAREAPSARSMRRREAVRIGVQRVTDRRPKFYEQYQYDKVTRLPGI
jgi:hypothetical protein